MIGYFEPHGRQETIAKTEGLETDTAPRLSTNAARSSRRWIPTPSCAASPPSPWSTSSPTPTCPARERAKRWQDVQVLLDAGIDVLTTMNVQHLESLNDQVWHITGVRVRETVPDWVVDEADEVVMVDLTPRALRNRLERGVVYAPEKARSALENFFTEAQPHRAARDGHAPHRPRGGGEADSRRNPPRGAHPDLPHRRPSSAMLIRRGKRVADYLHADCLAVHVPRSGIATKPWSAT